METGDQHRSDAPLGKGGNDFNQEIMQHI